MSGSELIDEMRKRPELSAIDVVVSTSAPNRAPPGVRVLTKPIDIGTVWECMRQACRCALRPPRSPQG